MSDAGAPFLATDHLEDIKFDAPAMDPDLEQERRIAIYDLLEENCFALPAGAPGPYTLRIDCDAGEWRFHVGGANLDDPVRFALQRSVLAPLLTDYLALCGDYREAIKRLAPSQIEQIDQERRALHSEASEKLRVAAATHMRIDGPTARRLFTVLCAVGEEGEERL